jgi:hypothetical protein
MSPTQREMCELHAQRLDRIENKVDVLDSKIDKFILDLATRDAKTKFARGMVDGFFGLVAAVSAVYAVFR